jgi:vacuolar-type H+-ATPase subunit H
MPSHDILDKLFSVEKKAETIVSAAQEESEKRIAAAKDLSEASFKSAYERKGSELSSGLSEAKKRSDQEFSDELASFSSRLEATKKDRTAFASLCDGFLAGKA